MLKLLKLDFLSPMILLVLDLLSPRLLILDLPPLDLISSKFLPSIELLLLLKLFLLLWSKLFLPWSKLFLLLWSKLLLEL